MAAGAEQPEDEMMMMMMMDVEAEPMPVAEPVAAPEPIAPSVAAPIAPPPAAAVPVPVPAEPEAEAAAGRWANLKLGWSEEDASKARRCAKRKATDGEESPPKRRKTARGAATPEVVRRLHTPGSRRRSQHKTSEEIELEKIEELKRKAAKQKRLSRESFKRLSQSSEYVPVRSDKPLTQPEEFDFKTDQVLKRHRSGSRLAGPTSDPIQHNSPSRFGMILRSFGKKSDAPAAAPDEAAKPKEAGPTKPKPFRFQSRIRDGAAALSKPFVAMAQQVQKFASKTPTRYRKRPAKDDHYQPAEAAAAGPAGPTVPVSPDLQTAKRPKRSTSVSTLQMEEQLLAEAKPFRARPVNPDILNSQGDYGVPRIPKKAPTMPEDIKLNTEVRAQKWAEHQEPAAEDKAPAFSARPVPKGLFEEVTGLPPKSDRPLTEPKTPGITKPRPRAPSEDAEPEPVAPFQAQPLPDLTKAFKVNPEHKHTVPEPFPHVSTHPDPREKRAALVAQEEERMRKLRSFLANPLPPIDRPAELPPKEVKPPTTVEPFPLRSLELHEQRKQHWEQKISEELASEQAKAIFKASECTSTKTAPYVAKPSSKPLTEISEFHLNTENRLAERKQFDSFVKEKELQEAERRRKQEEEAKALEEEIVRLV